jgi:hypothetical protein
MDSIALAVASVSVILALLALWKASVANQRAQAAERRVALAFGKDEAAIGRALPLPEAKSTPRPAAKAEPAPKPASRPKVEPEPATGPLDPAVRARLTKMLRQARDLARHVSLDRQVTVHGETGFRVPVDVEDDLDRKALAHLERKGEPAVLEVVQEAKGAFLVIKP